MALKTSPPSCLSGLFQLPVLMKRFMQMSFGKHYEKKNTQNLNLNHNPAFLQTIICTYLEVTQT